MSFLKKKIYYEYYEQGEKCDFSKSDKISFKNESPQDNALELNTCLFCCYCVTH